MNLSNVPIKRKLMLVIMLTSGVVLLLTSAAFIAYELLNYRTTLLQGSSAMAQIIAANSTAALSFADEKVGTEILSKLNAEPSIVAAALYDKNDKMLARFPAEQRRADFPDRPERDGYHFEHGTLVRFSPVREGETRLGTLYIKTDLTPMYQRFRLYGGIVIAVMIGSILIALLLSNWLQKRISEPILELAGTAQAVSQQRDYLVRARKFGNDELGLLTDAFNHMLMEIHQRDTALRQSEQRLRLALEASKTGTWDADTERGLVRWDNRMYALFGLPVGTGERNRGEMLESVHPEDRFAFEQQMNRALEQGTDFLAEFRVIWPDKSIHYLASRGKAFHNEGGRPVRMSGVMLDITEAKERAEALALLAAIVESSDDAIIGKTLNGTIMSWNLGAERMFGFTAKEAIGHHIEIVVPPDRMENEIRAMKKIATGRIEHFETVRLRKNGSLAQVAVTMSPIKNAAGEIIGISASSHDISERLRAEEEIRRLNAELEQRVLKRTAELAATNKELEAFTYSVSHDLRAPLRHIDAFAQIIEEEAKNMTPEIRRYVARIRRGVQNMGKLVDDLLNLSRVGRATVSRQVVSLNALVDEVLVDIRPEYENRDIEWKIGKLPTAECDPGLIKQVFTNLISNAIKYTRPRPKAVIEIDSTIINGEKAIFVRDNGVGFNMKYADKLFGVFQRLHRAEEFEGTGVGLATVQRIVQLHQGRIWADAELDKGATFYFTLRGIRGT